MRPASVSTKQAQIAELAKAHPAWVFTTLHHLIDKAWLRTAYELTRKDGAPGIDGVTAADYEANLDQHLDDLLHRLKTGRYVAPPVRRAYIPKADGSQRPLGIPTFEDKVAQRAIMMLLEPLYEQTFLLVSYGVRPGRSAHQALRALRDHIMDAGGRWILDLDIQRYFDTIEHRKLRAVLDQRVRDGVIRRLIDKWLNAGVLEEGNFFRRHDGTPQGGVISPLLANIFLHAVLDEWFVRDVVPRLKRRVALVRFADDAVLVFEDFLDAIRVKAVLPKRFGKYGLQLHPTKTRLIDFRFQRPAGGRHPATQGTTFDFLGFTHVWGRSRRGKNVVYQRTAKDRYRRSLRAITDYCHRFRHRPVVEQQARLRRMMTGHIAYYGITGNGRRLRWYTNRIYYIWYRWLARRSCSGGVGRLRYEVLRTRYPLPLPRIVHRYAAIGSEPVG